MATSVDPLWMRVSVAGKIHKPLALIDLLYIVFGLPKAGCQLFNLLINFKNNLPKKLKKLIRKDQWDLLCHDCNNQAVPCPTSCPKQGVSDLNDLDVTTLAILYRNIEHIIPAITPQLMQLKAQYKPIVEQACEDRNLLMHFSSKNMTQKEFDDRWNSTENCLNGMNYANMSDFNKMKTCLLDKYYKQQMDWLSDVSNDLNLRVKQLETKKGDDADIKINEQNIKG